MITNSTMISNLRQDLIEYIGEWLDSETVIKEEVLSGIHGDPDEDDKLHIKMAEAAINIYCMSRKVFNTPQKVRFHPKDTDEIFEGTVIEETKYSFLVIPDDDFSVTTRWNKNRCQLIVQKIAGEG